MNSTLTSLNRLIRGNPDTQLEHPTQIPLTSPLDCPARRYFVTVSLALPTTKVPVAVPSPSSRPRVTSLRRHGSLVCDYSVAFGQTTAFGTT